MQKESIEKDNKAVFNALERLKLQEILKTKTPSTEGVF